MSNFSAISYRKQATSWWDNYNDNDSDDDDHDDVPFVIHQHGELDFNSATSLEQQSVGRHAAPFEHIILIPSQAVFDLTAFLSEKQHIPIS